MYKRTGNPPTLSQTRSTPPPPSAPQDYTSSQLASSTSSTHKTLHTPLRSSRSSTVGDMNGKILLTPILLLCLPISLLALHIPLALIKSPLSPPNRPTIDSVATFDERDLKEMIDSSRESSSMATFFIWDKCISDKYNSYRHFRNSRSSMNIATGDGQLQY